MNTISRVVNTVRVGALALADRRVPYWSEDRILRRQNRRVRAIVRHAYRTVPYYRATMDRLGLKPADFRTAADLTRLPMIDDLQLHENASQFTSSTFDAKSALRMFTTGSYSGVPKHIVTDLHAGLARLVVSARDRDVLSKLLGRGWGQLQLFLLPSVSNTFRVQDYWDAHTVKRRTLARRIVSSAEAPLDEAIARMNDVKPHVVFSYGSYADEFFRYIADVKPKVALPRVWMYGGDMMSRQGRVIAEKEFGCIVYSTYNAVETGKLGFECERRSGFHLNVDYCAVRLIDESGRDVPAGTPGEIVISNLYNRAMVLLNYRMGDVAVMATGPCPCGRTLPLLAQLQGKTMEFLRFANGSRHIDSVLEVSFEKELSGVLQCQVCQSGPAGVLWRIAPASTADKSALERAICEKSRETLGAGIDVKVEFVERIARGPGGKLFRVGRS